MRGWSILLGLSFVGAAPVTACPAWEYPASRGYTVDGGNLRGGNDYSVIAGGDQRLRDCGFAQVGQVMARPDFEFHFRNMDRYGRLRLRVMGECDTVLLVNGASGYWYYDDNSVGYDPVLEFRRSLDGTFDVWVGTYGPATCAATLLLEAL